MKCLLCEETCYIFQDEKTDIHYFECKKCAFVFKSPEHHESMEVQKTRYDLHENSEESEGYIAYFQRFLDFLLPRIPKPKSALDFGCGESTLLANLLKAEGIACDYFDPIYHPDTLDTEKKYDLIVSTEVFEHLHQPLKVFEELLSQLNPQGYLAIQTQFCPKKRSAFLTWYYHKDPTHIAFFSIQSFMYLCERYHCDLIADNGKNMVLIQKSNEAGV